MPDALAQRTVYLKPLRGYHEGSVDKAGRVRLPAALLEHLESSDISKFWITTLTGSGMSIYPIREWEQVEQALLNPEPEQRKAFADVRRLADFYGEDVKLDAQGRVMLPVKLRRKLNLEDASVCFRVMRGYIEVVREDALQAEADRIESGMAAHQETLEASGLL
jgi:DNA-binding transcriptional regulator/RsmH inhibitor MraZ